MKRKVPLLFLLGCALILVSMGLGLFFGIRMYLGNKHGTEAISQLEALLPERTSALPELYPEGGMPVLQVEGVDYVAILEIPSYSLKLPIADQWDSKKINACPARFWGSAYGEPLVIGGSDSSVQFSFCDEIEHGTLITLTDMTGAQFDYTVCHIDRAKHAETQWLTDDDYDLTLFCHDTGNMEYIAVRCDYTYTLEP